jgi:hypothetical protein
MDREAIVRFKTGGSYYIIFHDHCVGDDDPVECEVFGRVIKQCDNFVTISWWNVLNSTKEVQDSNREIVNIVKSTILKKRKLIF